MAGGQHSITVLIMAIGELCGRRKIP